MKGYWFLLNALLGNFAYHADPSDPTTTPLLVTYLTWLTLAILYGLYGVYGTRDTRRDTGVNLDRYTVTYWAIFGAATGAGFAWAFSMAGAMLAIMYLGATA